MGRAEGPVDMNSGKAWALIYRDKVEVKFESLSRAGFVFHENVWKQSKISAARAEAQKIDPAFDEREGIAQLKRAAAHLNIF
jgi:hypothetical protein